MEQRTAERLVKWYSWFFLFLGGVMAIAFVLLFLERSIRSLGSSSAFLFALSPIVAFSLPYVAVLMRRRKKLLLVRSGISAAAVIAISYAVSLIPSIVNGRQVEQHYGTPFGLVVAYFILVLVLCVAFVGGVVIFFNKEVKSLFISKEMEVPS